MSEAPTTSRGRRACLRAAIGSLGVLALPASALGRAPANAVHRQLRFTLSLTNPGPNELRNQALWLYAPALSTPTQQLLHLEVSTAHTLHADALGHQVVGLEFARFPPWGSKLVTLVATVALRQAPAAAPLDDPQAWLHAERHIEAADPRIHALAAELKRADTQDTARAIYDWVRQQLRYDGYVADDRGALHALIERRGDCTEYAGLAVALARANGIPARRVGGHVCDRDAVLRAHDYHDWAEVHVDGAWRLLDAQKEKWLVPAEQYVAFRYYRDRSVNAVGLAHRFLVSGELQARL